METVTVAPTSPLPVTIVPSGATLAVSPTGAVRSGATSGTGSDRLPLPSACRTSSNSPSRCGVVSVTKKTPLPSTSAVPSDAPVASRTMIVEPETPVPSTVVPSALIEAIGAGGAVPSGATTMAGGDGFCAGSVCTTCSASPLVCGVVRTTL